MNTSHSRPLLLFLLLPGILLAAAAPCQPGTFKDGSKCTSCPPNTISTTRNARKCNPCPTRFLPNSKKTECIICPPGNFVSAADGFDCIPCEIGKYNPKPGATDCITCPLGRVTFAMGARSPLECGNCPKGFFLLFGETDVKCTFCPIGTYSDEENSTFCKVCPRGQFSHVGSPRCSDCPAGTFGVMPPEGVNSCNKCPEGSYQNLEGQSKCLPCPKQSRSVADRKKCKPTCTKGSKGCRSCSRGRGFDERKGRCKVCRAETVSTGRSATGCHRCPEGMFPNAKRTRCICPDGTGFIDGACRECPFNAKVVKNVKCVCMGDFLLRDGGCLCPSGEKPVGLKCVGCSAAEKKDVIENFRGPCEFCEAGHFWNEEKMSCEPCTMPNANPTRNFERKCIVPSSS